MSSAALAALRRFYAGRRVLVTGHTGFKGAWLTLWLQRLGAVAHGLALPPDQGPDNLFDQAGVARAARSRFLDIRDAGAVSEAVAEARPEIVFHLAARALVQQGYDDPVGMIGVNVLGTAAVLEAARRCPSVTTVVCVTTDKVYRNREWPWPYRETDELGGLDAYSASKASAELVARAWRCALRPADRPFAVATARGGNVIGGGDWSAHRLVPDIVRAMRAGAPLVLRHPGATRPWQHALDICFGYLLLGQRLAEDPAIAEPEGWNFGPPPGTELAVGPFADAFLAAWGAPDHPVSRGSDARYEATMLRLDPSRAAALLGWRQALDAPRAIAWSAAWYRDYLAAPERAAALVMDQIERYESIVDGPSAA